MKPQDRLAAGPDGRQRRLRRVARLSWWLAALAGLLVAGCEGFLALRPEVMLEAPEFAPYRDGAVLGAAGLTALWVIAFVPAGLFIALLGNAASLFARFLRGEIFHPALPRRLGWIGGLAIATAFARVAASTLGVVLISASRPQRELVITLRIADDTMAFLVLGLLVSAIALVMREALLIEEDNRSIV